MYIFAQFYAVAAGYEQMGVESISSFYEHAAAAVLFLKLNFYTGKAPRYHPSASDYFLENEINANPTITTWHST